jgi:hypothetical protein
VAATSMHALRVAVIAATGRPLHPASIPRPVTSTAVHRHHDHALYEEKRVTADVHGRHNSSSQAENASSILVTRSR